MIIATVDTNMTEATVTMIATEQDEIAGIVDGMKLVDTCSADWRRRHTSCGSKYRCFLLVVVPFVLTIVSVYHIIIVVVKRERLKSDWA